MSAKAFTIFTDGGARGNPGPAGIGVVIYDREQQIVGEIAEYLGEATNNQAEYRALVAGLRRVLELGGEAVAVRADSELMVRQVLGQYKVRHPELRPLYAEVVALKRRFQEFSIAHVRREENSAADALVNQAIDAAL